MQDQLIGMLTRFVETGRVPDALVRAGIRYNVKARQTEMDRIDSDRATTAFMREMDAAPIALIPEVANTQHYEVPAAFFEHVLGPRRKYSCCLWDEPSMSLADAEDRALQLVVERAGIEDGMTVLDLGCGWGSLSLFLAERFPHVNVIGVSNSRSQAEFIQAQAQTLGASRVRIVTADMNGFDPGRSFDRVVSIEMFEHMRNWRLLFARVANWLNPDGRFFLHVFSHATTPYPYVDRGEGDWMSRFFFSGGMMPSQTLAAHIAPPEFDLEAQWRLDGTHYARTANAWLHNMDNHPGQIRAIFRGVYGDQSERWWVRWRIFFMACAEMFAADQGRLWGVTHVCFRNRDTKGRA